VYSCVENESAGSTTHDLSVTATFLRGQQIFGDGKMIGTPTGRYLHRPTGR
jgi:hypothetical protein